MIPAVALAAAAALSGPVAAPPRAALAVSPAHIELAAGGRAAVHVETRTGTRLVVRVGIAGLALDLRGRPRIAGRRDAAPWLTVSPRTVELGREGATIVIASRRAAAARPGDHTALVLFSARAAAPRGVAVELRVGLMVTVRITGRTVHRLVVTAVLARRVAPAGSRLLELTLANRGNVIEWVGGASLRITVLHGGRVIARLTAVRRKVLPHARALVSVWYRSRRRGSVTVRVSVARAGGGHSAARSFPLRL